MASAAHRFDQADFKATKPAKPSGSGLTWPIDPQSVTRVGDAVMEHRKKTGRPHHGVDIFATAWTQVVAAAAGTVIRIVDGRFSLKDSTKRAGLFLDVKGDDSNIYRYLHLGETPLVAAQRVLAGQPIAFIAPALTSGAGEAPHLHFEIRGSDYDSQSGQYGKPINPLLRLPALRA